MGHPHAIINNSTGTANNAHRVRAHPVAAQINSTPSPQLSLAEFLQDEYVDLDFDLVDHKQIVLLFSPSLEDDDSRKRRRKKERSSLFFRKKKDKIQNLSGSNGKPPSIQHHALFDPQVYFELPNGIFCGPMFFEQKLLFHG